MAIIVTSANTTTPIAANVSGNVYVVLPNVFVTPSADAVNGANTTTGKSIIVHGGLISENNAIDLGSAGTGGSNRVHISATGTLYAEGNAIESDGGSLDLLNEGSIFSAFDAILLNQDFNEVVNRGSIVGLSDGIDSNGDFAIITNYGLIQGADEGVEIFGNGSTVYNYGYIVSTNTSINNEAIEITTGTGETSKVLNVGVISAVGAIIGGSSNDTVINRGQIFGQVSLGPGDDRFDGRGGSVEGEVSGGSGDDEYLIDNAGIDLIELAGQGTDTVRTWVSYALADNVEDLFLQGDEEIDGTGNGQNNTITGNNAANIINGSGGDDMLLGGWGDDILNGDDGNDTLRGHAGADRMVGGLGDDTYFVDVIADQLVEYAGEGTDSVFSPVSFALRDYSQHLENLTLTGSGNISGTGNGQVNTITGNDGNNTLNGADGNDLLFGGLGNDTFMDDNGIDEMTGGLGDDVYFVDNALDQLFELAGEGTDSVFSPISFALRDKSQHLENLTLTGSANIDGTGNGQANTITGNSGNNLLNGAGGTDILIGGAGNDIFQDDSGADQMAGGAGNDTYFVDNAADSLIELLGEGTDSVFSSVSLALRNKSQHLENLTLTGSGNIDGTGNGQANIITGNSGNNTLNGAGGNDTLNGGAGDDIYNDDAGADRFEFSVFDGLQNDVIVGFVNTQDTIAIALGAFNQSTVNVTSLGGNTFITYGDGLSTLQLSGVTLAEVDIVFSFS